MNEREKLIELLNDIQRCGEDYTEYERYGINYPDTVSNENVADYLLAHGVTVLPDNNVGKWIPVTERLPEIVETKKAWNNIYRWSDRVLCACLQKDGKRMVKEGYMEYFNDYLEPNWRIPGTIHSVTHWKPMPEPPKEG